MAGRWLFAVVLTLCAAAPAPADVRVHDAVVVAGPALSGSALAWADVTPDRQVTVHSTVAPAGGSVWRMRVPDNDLGYRLGLSAGGGQAATSWTEFPYHKCCLASDRFSPVTLSSGPLTGPLAAVASCTSQDADPRIVVTDILLARLDCQPTFEGNSPVLVSPVDQPTQARQVGAGEHVAAAGRFVAWTDGAQATVLDTASGTSVALAATDVVALSVAPDGALAWTSLPSGGGTPSLHWAASGSSSPQSFGALSTQSFAALADGVVASVVAHGAPDQIVRFAADGTRSALAGPLIAVGGLSSDGTRLGYAARTCDGSVLRVVPLAGPFPAENIGPCPAHILRRGLIERGRRPASLDVWVICQEPGPACRDSVVVRSAGRTIGGGHSAAGEPDGQIPIALNRRGRRLAAARGNTFAARVVVTRRIAGRRLHSARSVTFARPSVPHATDGLPPVSQLYTPYPQGVEARR